MRLTPYRAALHARWYRAQGRDAEALALEDYNADRGHCRRCGRKLTDPHSIDLGIGPECFQKQPPRDAA
jgi:hypothetical protein